MTPEYPVQLSRLRRENSRLRREAAQQRSEHRLRLARALLRSGQLVACHAELTALRGLTARQRTIAARLQALTARLLGELHQARALARTHLPQAGDPRSRTTLRLELITAELLDGTVRKDLFDVSRLASASAGEVAALSCLRLFVEVTTGSLRTLAPRLEASRRLINDLDDADLGEVLGIVLLLAWVELMVDQPERCLDQMRRAGRLAIRYGLTHLLPQLHPLRSLALARIGRLNQAIRAAEDSEEAARAAGSAELLAFSLAAKSRPLCWQAGPAAATVVIGEFGEAGPPRSTWHRVVADAALAEALLAVGDPSRCLDHLRPWLADRPSRWGALAPSLAALAAQAYLEVGDLALAQRWGHRASLMAQRFPLPSVLGAVAHAGAGIAMCQDRVADAVRLAREAVQQFRRAQSVVRAEQARLTLAEGLVRAGQPGHALREAGAAKQALTNVDATWLAAKAERMQRQIGARLPRKAQEAGLTLREQEIARLVAEGLTNRAIAERLYLSPRTVESHLSRIMAKLGAPSRTVVARLTAI